MTLALANLDAERSLLGSILVDNTTLALVRPLVPAAGCFSDSVLGRVYTAVLKLADDGKPIVPTTLWTELANAGIAEPARTAADLVDAVGSAENAEIFAEMVRDCWRRRLVTDQATKLAQKVRDPAIALDEALAETVLELSRDHTASPVALPSFRDAVMDLALATEKRAGQRGLVGMRTGLGGLDGLLRGYRPGKVTVLAASASVGKTSLALHSMVSAIEQHGDPGAVYVSLEMDQDELTERMLSSHLGWNVDQLDYREPSDWEIAQIARVAPPIANLPLAILEHTVTPAAVQLMVQREMAKRPIGLLVIDYLQLMDADVKTQNQDRKIGEITKALKRMARKLRIHILLLSQLNRESGREKRPPELYDLRDSGCIEQDADAVLMLHQVAEPERGPRPVDAYLRKNRGGPRGKLSLSFKSWIGQWTEASESDKQLTFQGGMNKVVAVETGSIRPGQALYAYEILPNGCWQWLGFTASNGYGKLWDPVVGKKVLVHRYMYERRNGAIAKDLVLDHLCRNRSCCNPEHLEPVLQRTNLVRGIGFVGNQTRRQRCPKGHPLVDGNLVPGSLKRGQRTCLKCSRELGKVRQQARRDRAKAAR